MNAISQRFLHSLGAYRVDTPLRLRERSEEVWSNTKGMPMFDTKTNMQLFCPRLRFLNAQHEPVHDEGLPLRFVPPTWLTGGRWQGEASVPPQARYVVLYAAANKFGTLHSARSKGTGYAFSTGSSTVFVPGSPQTYSYPCGPIGIFRVTLK